MATSDILGLFTSPQQYQQNQLAQFQNRAAQEVQLSPFQQAALGARTAGYQLGQGIGGALGGQDPQLQKITQRQQILGMIDPNNPDSFAQAIQAALQVGDQEAAYLLRNEMMKTRQQSQENQLKNLQITDALTERGLGMQNRGMAANALELSKTLIKSDGTVDETIYNQLLGYGKVGTDIIEQRLKATQGLESQQVQNLAKGLINPDGTRNKEVENKLSTTVAGRAILKQFAPETREIKKGEKLLERTPSGAWKLITPEGQPAQTVSSDNAIQSLITGKAIHPTVLPYAQQLARNFVNLDFEDQNVLMEKLTKINNDAQKYASEKNARDQSRETSNSLRDLNIQLAELKIKEAQAKSLKAEDGKEINRITGAKTREELENFIIMKKLLKRIFNPDGKTMNSDENEMIEKLILEGGLEVAGLDSENGSFLYSFTPKIKELMPELYNDHLNRVNSEILSLWERAYVDIDFLAKRASSYSYR